MIRVNKQNPCPVCGHTDWCLIAEDGTAVICARVSDGSKKKSGEAGWLHILKDRPKTDHKVIFHKPVEVKPQIGFMTKYAMKYHRNLPDCSGLAKELGVSQEALDSLLVGTDHRAYTFPMKNGKEQIIGIRLRTDRAKFSVVGSQNGLFWPVGIKADSKELLYVCEGPTDCAAL